MEEFIEQHIDTIVKISGAVLSFLGVNAFRKYYIKRMKQKQFLHSMDNTTYSILYTFYETQENRVHFRNLTEYFAYPLYIGSGHSFVFGFTESTQLETLEKEGFIERSKNSNSNDIVFVLDWKIKDLIYKFCKKKGEPKTKLPNVASHPTYQGGITDYERNKIEQIQKRKQTQETDKPV